MIKRTHGVRNARHHFACDAIILPYTCSNPWCDDKYFYTSAVYRNYVVGICFLPCLALTDRLHDNKWCNRFTRLLKLKNPDIFNFATTTTTKSPVEKRTQRRY